METKIDGRQIAQKVYITVWFMSVKEIPLKLLATFKENNSAIHVQQCELAELRSFWMKCLILF